MVDVCVRVGDSPTSGTSPAAKEIANGAISSAMNRAVNSDPRQLARDRYVISVSPRLFSKRENARRRISSSVNLLYGRSRVGRQLLRKIISRMHSVYITRNLQSLRVR